MSVAKSGVFTTPQLKALFNLFSSEDFVVFCIVKLLNWVHEFKKSGKFQCIWYGLYNGMWATNIQLAFCTTSNIDTFKVMIQVTNCYSIFLVHFSEKKVKINFECFSFHICLRFNRHLNVYFK